MASPSSDRDSGHLCLAVRLRVSLPKVSLVSTSPCQQAGKRKGRKGTAPLIKGTSRMLEAHVCLHAIGQNWVTWPTWPHPAEMKSGKCSLYSKWAAPSKMVGFVAAGGEMNRSLPRPAPLTHTCASTPEKAPDPQRTPPLRIPSASHPTQAVFLQVRSAAHLSQTPELPV